MFIALQSKVMTVFTPYFTRYMEGMSATSVLLPKILRLELDFKLKSN